ncbi:MAG TPA: hypothetical protein VF761_02255 [Gemmatimonadaceae bacterium]
MPHDSIRSGDDHGWLVTPRALTTLATIVSLIYALHQPVRWVMQVAATVDMLGARVAALEGEVARERERRDTLDSALAALASHGDPGVARPSGRTH